MKSSTAPLAISSVTDKRRTISFSWSPVPQATTPLISIAPLSVRARIAPSSLSCSGNRPWRHRSSICRSSKPDSVVPFWLNLSRRRIPLLLPGYWPIRLSQSEKGAFAIDTSQYSCSVESLRPCLSVTVRRAVRVQYSFSGGRAAFSMRRVTTGSLELAPSPNSKRYVSPSPDECDPSKSSCAKITANAGLPPTPLPSKRTALGASGNGTGVGVADGWWRPGRNGVPLTGHRQ